MPSGRSWSPRVSWTACASSRSAHVIPSGRERWPNSSGCPNRATTRSVLNNPDIDLVYLPLPSTVQARWAVRRSRRASSAVREAAGGGRDESGADRRGRGCRRQTRFRRLPLSAAWLHASAAGGARLGGAGPDSARRVRFPASLDNFVVKPGNIRLDGDLGGGSFMDVGCYAVDLIRVAWGEPTVISAEAVLSTDDPRVDLQTDAVLELRGRHPRPCPVVVHRRRPGQHVAAGHRRRPRPWRRRVSSCRSGVR